jgi:hypothetical protein
MSGLKNNKAGEWYPGALTPHLFYISKELVGMAAAIPRKLGQDQKWEAFDMRCRSVPDNGPLRLGEHDTLELAQQQVELEVTGALC